MWRVSVSSVFVIATLFVSLVSFDAFGSERHTLEATYTQGNEIQISKIEAFALAQARELWGQVALGPVIPLCDLRGNILAYEVVFCLSSEDVPEDQVIFKKIRKAKQLSQGSTKRNKQAEKDRWGIGSYMTMIVGGSV